jgi:hypothetical protein
VSTIAQHALRVQQEPRRGWISRLHEWWTVRSEPVVDDWTEPEPTSRVTPPAARPGPQPQPAHPPFGQPQAYCQHVLDRMQHLLIDLRRDPSMTATQAAGALRALNLELSGLVQQEQNQPRRMERNLEATAAQRVLLEDALHGADPEELVAHAASTMKARAVHVGSLQDTGIGTIPRITEDMPDPREAAAESTPLPSEPFLTAAEVSAPVALANEAMALRTPTAPVEVEPDVPWSPDEALRVRDRIEVISDRSVSEEPDGEYVGRQGVIEDFFQGGPVVVLDGDESVGGIRFEAREVRRIGSERALAGIVSDRPWSPVAAALVETSESLSAICDVDDEQAVAGSAVSR